MPIENNGKRRYMRYTQLLFEFEVWISLFSERPKISPTFKKFHGNAKEKR